MEKQKMKLSKLQGIIVPSQNIELVKTYKNQQVEKIDLTGTTLISYIWCGHPKDASPTAFKLENKDGKGNTWIVYDPSTGTYYQTSEEIANKYFSNNSYLIKDKNLPTKYSAQ